MVYDFGLELKMALLNNMQLQKSSSDIDKETDFFFIYSAVSAGDNEVAFSFNLILYHILLQYVCCNFIITAGQRCLDEKKAAS